VNGYSGTATFSTQSDEDLFSESARKSAIRGFLKENGNCKFTALLFKAEAAEYVFGYDPLRVILGVHGENSVTIRAATTRYGVDYVIKCLREFD
jgi:hypothetical protein